MMKYDSFRPILKKNKERIKPKDLFKLLDDETKANGDYFKYFDYIIDKWVESLEQIQRRAIGEMVYHNYEFHTKQVFEIVVRIVEEIKKKELINPFFNEIELFILGASALLHDIGMGGGRIYYNDENNIENMIILNNENIKTKTQIRKYHGLLGSYKLLKSGSNYFPNKIIDGREISISEEIIKAISSVIRYHQRKFDIMAEDYIKITIKNFNFEEENDEKEIFVNPLNPELEINGNNIRLRLITALIRIADSVDNNEKRVSGVNEFKYQIEDKILEILKLLCNLITNSENKRKILWNISYKKLNDIKEKYINKLNFLFNQPIHLKKHQLCDNLDINIYENEFIITYLLKYGHNDETIIGVSDYEKIIIEEISSEFEKLKKIEFFKNKKLKILFKNEIIEERILKNLEKIIQTRLENSNINSSLEKSLIRSSTQLQNKIYNNHKQQISKKNKTSFDEDTFLIFLKKIEFLKENRTMEEALKNLKKLEKVIKDNSIDLDKITTNTIIAKFFKLSGLIRTKHFIKKLKEIKTIIIKQKNDKQAKSISEIVRDPLLIKDYKDYINKIENGQELLLESIYYNRDDFDTYAILASACSFYYPDVEKNNDKKNNEKLIISQKVLEFLKIEIEKLQHEEKIKKEDRIIDQFINDSFVEEYFYNIKEDEPIYIQLYKLSCFISGFHPYPLGNILIHFFKLLEKKDNIKLTKNELLYFEDILLKPFQYRLREIELNKDAPWSYFDIEYYALLLNNFEKMDFLFDIRIFGLLAINSIWMYESSLKNLDISFLSKFFKYKNETIKIVNQGIYLTRLHKILREENKSTKTNFFNFDQDFNSDLDILKKYTGTQFLSQKENNKENNGIDNNNNSNNYNNNKDNISEYSKIWSKFYEIKNKNIRKDKILILLLPKSNEINENEKIILKNIINTNSNTDLAFENNPIIIILNERREINDFIENLIKNNQNIINIFIGKNNNIYNKKLDNKNSKNNEIKTSITYDLDLYLLIWTYLIRLQPNLNNYRVISFSINEKTVPFIKIAFSFEVHTMFLTNNYKEKTTFEILNKSLYNLYKFSTNKFDNYEYFIKWNNSFKIQLSKEITLEKRLFIIKHFNDIENKYHLIQYFINHGYIKLINDEIISGFYILKENLNPENNNNLDYIKRIVSISFNNERFTQNEKLFELIEKNKEFKQEEQNNLNLKFIDYNGSSVYFKTYNIKKSNEKYEITIVMLTKLKEDILFEKYQDIYLKFLIFSDYIKENNLLDYNKEEINNKLNETAKVLFTNPEYSILVQDL